MQNILEIKEASPATLAALPAETLMRLEADAATHLKSASQIVAVLHGELVRRYATGLNGTGTHHRTDGGVDITVMIPKRVEWDQAKLDTALDTIESWGEQPTDYVDIEIKVAERKYDAWPPAIRDLFTPARTVKTGKPSFKLTPAQAEAA